ncbi:ABC transporter ATP-binding protein [Lysinibacillus fusiformis]|uniref:ABC transporter ATP-binding protein n=1 Tax=Lysinibacillus fusiformis TaxID=28031 RepID=UPI001FB154FD|nr:energy-coupling factor ABC transporter ATP-binding protein [Lysinibacillus fusiformis]
MHDTNSIYLITKQKNHYEKKLQVIALTNVNFQYNSENPLLKNISLTINEGEFIVLTGPSGSGKTTLSRIINGLIPHFYDGQLHGQVTINHTSLLDLPMWHLSQWVGSVFQDPKAQFFTANVYNEIAFELENHGIHQQTIARRVEDVCEQMTLNTIKHQSLHSLSSGQKQKVAIAAATAIEPLIYVMDEPSANLDLQATNILQNELLRLKKSGKTIIVAEHRLYYLMTLADRIIYMEDGQIQREYRPEQLLALSAQQLQQFGLRSPSLTNGYKKTIPSRGKEPVITSMNLCVSYNKIQALDYLQLHLQSGEVCALIGQNGAGKTTLARTIAGLIKEKKGEIRIHGDVKNAKKRLEDVWLVMQDTVYQLFTDSVWNELLLNKPLREETLEYAEDLLKSLKLWHLKDQHPATLSGGEKQRLVLAIGLMQHASIFILDEPTSGLDGFNLQRVIEIIQQLKERNCHILVITHDYELVAGACDRIIKLQSGKITDDIATENLSFEDIVHIMQ